MVRLRSPTEGTSYFKNPIALWLLQGCLAAMRLSKKSSTVSWLRTFCRYAANQLTLSRSYTLTVLLSYSLTILLSYFLTFLLSYPLTLVRGLIKRESESGALPRRTSHIDTLIMRFDDMLDNG